MGQRDVQRVGALEGRQGLGVAYQVLAHVTPFLDKFSHSRVSHGADSVGRVIQVAAPLRVRERLSAAPDGPRDIVHTGATAIYVDLDGWCLGLVAATATRVPCALWSSLPDLSVLAGGPVEVVDGALVVAGHEVRVSRVVDPTVRHLGRQEIRVSEPAVLMTSGLGLPATGPLTPAHAEHLLGRGPGLTPLGDDVLAGWFVARHAAGDPDTTLADAVRPRLGATTLLSATLLDCAMRGEALPQLAAWLADPSPSTAEALVAVGATSGTGLLAGAELALSSRAAHHRPGRAA